MTEGNPPAIDERTFQRRRLAVLAGLLLAVLTLAPLLAPAGDDEAPVEVAAGADQQRVRIAGFGSPTAVRELLSETTTTLVEASGGETATPTTAAPTTTAATPTTAASAAADVDDEASPTTTAAAAPTRSTARASGAPTTTAAPPTTAAPTTAPPTTAAPRSTTTTTTAPVPEGEYARDDPRGTQVWHDLAQCESGGNWSIDTGNGYYGGLQFSLATWESVGGTGYPHEHPVATQMEMGRRLQARQGWGAWPHCSEKLGLH